MSQHTPTSDNGAVLGPDNVADEPPAKRTKNDDESSKFCPDDEDGEADMDGFDFSQHSEAEGEFSEPEPEQPMEEEGEYVSGSGASGSEADSEASDYDSEPTAQHKRDTSGKSTKDSPV